MQIITSPALLARRVNEAYRRRDALRDQREVLSRALPDWALMSLRFAGMSSREMEEVMAEQTRLEQASGIEQIDAELEQIDAEIERIEDQLLAAKAGGLDGIAAILQLAVDRLRERTVTDEASVFYDHGDARMLVMLERASMGLSGCLGAGRQLKAS
jgi:hypothetical protein